MQLSIYFHTHVSFGKCDNLRVQYTSLNAQSFASFDGLTTFYSQLHQTYKLYVIHINFSSLWNCNVLSRCTTSIRLHMTTATQQIRTDRYFYFMNKCDTNLLFKFCQIVPFLYALVFACTHTQAASAETRLITYPSFYCRNVSSSLLWA